MRADVPPRRQSEWHSRLVRSAYLIGAVLLHLIVFAMVAGLVIWKAQIPVTTDDFHAFQIKVPPPVPPVVSSGDAAVNPQLEPQPVTMPVVTPPAISVTVSNSAFTVDTSKAMTQAISHLSQATPEGAGTTKGGGEQGQGAGTSMSSVFGADSATGSNQLVGYFYDLKQTGDKKPTGVDLGAFYQDISDFLNRSWDDSSFDKFYKSKTPLYLDHLAISTRNSADAPKAFHLENEVQGGLWVVHYHGKVVPPAGGDYQFIGFADNVLVVKIDGTTVLEGSWRPVLTKKSLQQPLPWVFPSYVGAANQTQKPNLKIGTTFHVEDGVAVDLDVLIGDDGGGCNFFLLVKAADKNYDTLPDGTPKLPFFQLGAGKPPTFLDTEEHPPFSTTPEPWTSPTPK